MLKPKDLQDFWDYVKEMFDEDEIEDAFINSDFDIDSLSEDNILELSNSEVKMMYADLVYIIMNELGDGDFDTMYDILSENMCLEKEDIDYLLDW